MIRYMINKNKDDNFRIKKLVQFIYVNCNIDPR